MEFISRNNNKRKSKPEEIDDKTAAACAAGDMRTFDFEGEEILYYKVNTEILINRAREY